MTRGTSARRAARLVALLAVALGLVGCGDSWQGSATALRIGYMPNLTHAPAIVGVEGGFFEAALPAGVRLSTMTFNAGPNVIEALNAGSIDAAFVGANPTINGFVRSQGRALRVVAGTASGGAALVVRSGIETPEDLRGGRLATPQLGNTQDVAARHWLAEQGLETTRTGGGDVQILPQSNATALQSFRAGDVDGAWVPEPWASRFVLEGGAHVLVDESELWPDGRFVVTNLVVRTGYLEAHPQNVAALLDGLLDTLAHIDAEPGSARRTVDESIATLTRTSLEAEVLERAWQNVEMTYDPLVATMRTAAENAHDLGLLDSADLDGLWELDLLDAALEARGLDPVGAP